MKVFAAIDSFKGTISSLEISNIIYNYYNNKNVNIKTKAISDGGEGFLDAIKQKGNKVYKYVKVSGPLNDQIKTKYILNNKKAYVELSLVSGINLIEKEKLNPLKTSTYGLGEVIKDAIINGAKQIIVGIGGSATNDGGVGMLQALGVKFYDKEGLIKSKISGGMLNDITHFDARDLYILTRDIKFKVATDVFNPLLGEKGCSYVYAKQKGATDNVIQKLEENMTSYANLVEKTLNGNYKDKKGAGAAGGVGFAFMCFLKAKVVSGIKYIINELNIEKNIKEADLVLVGEGKFDKQTFFGKAPVGIAKLAKKHNKKVYGLFALSDNIENELFDKVYTIVPNVSSLSESIKDPINSFKKLLDRVEI